MPSTVVLVECSEGFSRMGGWREWNLQSLLSGAKAVEYGVFVGGVELDEGTTIEDPSCRLTGIGLTLLHGVGCWECDPIGGSSGCSCRGRGCRRARDKC